MSKLEPLPEDWTRGLAVVAHPDDMEYGAASAVARWTDQGKHLAYGLATKGEAGIRSLPPEKVGPARMQEQIAGCGVVGVSDVEFLDHPDGLVVADLELRRDLAGLIRRHRPDVVLSINYRDTWGGPSWNHADHRALGVALLDAVRDAGNPWLFTDLAEEAWDGVRFVAFNGSPEPSHYVDVTDTLERGVESLLCHKLYLDNLDSGGEGDSDGDGDSDSDGDGADMADAGGFLRDYARAAGERVGVDLATTFEVVFV